MGIEFEVSEVIRASPEAIYEAWLSSKGHTAMTGSPAHVFSEVGATFDAWDGYITGKNLELEYPKRIVQQWRTVEFDDADEDSRLEVRFVAEGGETRVTIRHSNLPEHGLQYRQGWIDAYFIPMNGYFAEVAGGSIV